MAMMSFSYNANTTLFSAMNVTAKTRSKDQLAAEEQDDKALAASGATGTSNIQTYNGLQTSGKTVMFDDPKSGNRVQLQLTDENLKRLEEKFGKQDFYTRSDGTIRLSGKAEAFVSGWFGDVAYRQNFLGADANNDGVISKSEFGNLKSGITGEAYLANGTINLVNERAYTSFSADQYDYVASRGGITLVDNLNYRLETDENLDGVLSSGESMTTENMQYLAQQLSSMQTSNGIGGFGNSGGFSLAGELAKLLKDDSKEYEAERKKEEEEKKLLEKIREQRKAAREAIEKLRENKNSDVKNLDNAQEASEPAKELQNNAQNVAKTGATKTLSELDKELISVVDNIREQTKSGAATAVNALDTTA